VSLMRTIAVKSNGRVAVVTESAESRRISVLVNPMVKVAATTMILLAFCSVVVDAKEVNVRYPATDAFWRIRSVVREDAVLEVSLPSSQGFVLVGKGGWFSEPRRHIAVLAEDAESKRKPLFDEPVGEFCLMSFFEMFLSAPINVIECQKLKDCLVTYGTLRGRSSVVGQCGHSSFDKELSFVGAFFLNGNRQQVFPGTRLTPSSQPISRASSSMKLRLGLYFFTSSASLLTDSGNFSPMLDLVLLPEAFGVCVCADPTVRSESIGMRFFFREIRSRLRLPALRAPLDLDFFPGYAFFSHRCSFLQKDGLGERPVPVRAGLGLDYYRVVKPWRQVA